MYMTARMMHVRPGHQAEFLALASEVVGRMNSDHGSSYALSMQVGGDPWVVGASAPWESMEAYQGFIDSAMADTSLADAGNEAAKLVSSAEDLIVRILTPPGDRSGFSAVNMARMHMPRITEAVPFALEVAEMAEAKTGFEVGVMHAVTGDRSQIAWMSRHDTLAELADTGAQLDGDPEFMELYKRSDGLLVDGSLEQVIWRSVG